MSKTVSVRVSDGIHQKLLDDCNKKGTTMNDKLKEMIDENVKNPSQEKKTFLENQNKDSEMINHLTKTVNGIQHIVNEVIDAVTKDHATLERVIRINHLNRGEMTCVKKCKS